MGFDYLQSKLNLEYQRLERLEKELSTLGDGSLHLRYDAGTTYFREYNNGRQHGITKDKNKIYKLARKDVVREKILLIKKRIEVLDDAVKRLDSIENDSNIHKLIERYNMLDEKRISFSKQELEIYNNRFSKNPFNKDRLIYKTQGNVAMRSKSERFIGTFIENEGVLYMYEPELVIDGRNIYPDFVLFRPDGKKVIWEHCGLMEDNDYYNKMVNRLNEYRKIGYVQHKNLICTYEEDLQDIETLKDIIQRFIYA